MKVLLFIETGGPGGAERVVATLASALKHNGVDVLVVTLREGWLTDRLDRMGIERRVLRSDSKLGLVFNLISIIKAENIDVIHSHLLDSNFYAAISAFFCQVPHIATEHGDVHHLEKKKFPRIKIKIISLLASKVFAVSAFTMKALIENGLTPEKCLVFPNPYQFPNNDSSIEKAAAIKALLAPDLTDLRQTTWIWIHVANLRKVKDQQTLLRGFAGAKSRATHPQKLLIVGDGSERGALEELSRSLGISEDVRFLGFRDDVEQLLATADGFILSSTSEAMPMSILEASAAGLLLVSTDVGGVPELIRDGETGYLFPAKNHSRLSEIIDRAVSQPEKSKEMATKARKELEGRTDLFKVVGRLMNFYEELCK